MKTKEFPVQNIKCSIDSAIREFGLLKSIKHQNIVNLKKVIHKKGKLYMIFEYLEYDLRKYILAQKEMLQEMIVKSFLYQILCGLAYCHSHRIIHRDLKPQNLLLSEKGLMKLADFGLGRIIEFQGKIYTHEIVTLWYRAPEILLGQQEYSFPVDIWSVGCIFAEMSHKKALFTGDSEIGQLFKIFQLLGTPTETNWPGVTKLRDYKSIFPKWNPQPLDAVLPNLEINGLDLLSKMITLDPIKRISAKTALFHV